ncbi:MAG: heme-binding beta-barrel domain-containing protein [Myxococcota bacterium]|nr:FABP family protein [Myxococcales bacterium]
MIDPSLLGPLAALAGTWEGDEGEDVAYDHDSGASATSRFRERMTFEPFGPVDNGRQLLFGLDYRTVATRLGEADPFHMEVGYWLWDAAAGSVMRCFMVPRGATVLAGGPAAADARAFRMRAERGSTTFGILANPYLDERARVLRYELEVAVEGGALAYREDTVLALAEMPGEYHHTDRNRLRRA